MSKSNIFELPSYSYYHSLECRTDEAASMDSASVCHSYLNHQKSLKKTGFDERYTTESVILYKLIFYHQKINSKSTKKKSTGDGYYITINPGDYIPYKPKTNIVNLSKKMNSDELLDSLVEPLSLDYTLDKISSIKLRNIILVFMRDCISSKPM